MKELLTGLVMFALVAGVSLFAVERLGDRETVVAPPDAIAEQFIRAVMCKRWEPAKEYLDDPESLSHDELEAMQRELGEGANVEAEIVSRDRKRAVVTVRVPSRGVEKTFALTFDGGWRLQIHTDRVRFPIHSSETSDRHRAS